MPEEYGVTLKKSAAGGVAQMIVWGDLQRQLSLILDKTLPLPGYDLAVSIDGFILFRIAPDRVQFHHADPTAIMSRESRVNLEDGAFCDLSHARARLDISGASSENAMSSLAPIDFSSSGFMIGAFRQTGIHGIHALIHRTAADSFAVWFPASWSHSLQRYIADAVHIHR